MKVETIVERMSKTERFYRIELAKARMARKVIIELGNSSDAVLFTETELQEMLLSATNDYTYWSGRLRSLDKGTTF
jgi:hypothetical protein